uniref:Uncharacterized protein n=1 Tax=Oryza nivara TaxID=4536 RepID=A0A0E0FMT0_ORYNI
MGLHRILPPATAQTPQLHRQPLFPPPNRGEGELATRGRRPPLHSAPVAATSALLGVSNSPKFSLSIGGPATNVDALSTWPQRRSQTDQSSIPWAVAIAGRAVMHHRCLREKIRLKNAMRSLWSIKGVMSLMNLNDGSTVMAKAFSPVLNLANLAEEVQIAYWRRINLKKAEEMSPTAKLGDTMLQLVQPHSGPKAGGHQRRLSLHDHVVETTTWGKTQKLLQHRRPVTLSTARHCLRSSRPCDPKNERRERKLGGRTPTVTCHAIAMVAYLFT